MPRTKGSKNRPKSDFASQISEKQTQITTLNDEIASITANINDLKANLKTKKSELKSAEKEVVKLEAKSEAEAVVKKLLAGGMSADEILEKLK